MPILITGLFAPSGGAGSFDLYAPEDIQAGDVNVILQLVAGGAVKGGVHATAPVGEIVAQVRTTTGPPTHSASEGTFCWNSVDNVLYVNNNGSTGWTEIGAGGVHAASHAEGAADTLVGQDVNVRRLRIEDIDGTPVGDIYLRVIDEVLEVRDATDATYKPIKVGDFSFQNLLSYATGSTWKGGASIGSQVLIQAYNGTGYETVAIIDAQSGVGTTTFQIVQGKLIGQLDANSQRIINLLAPSAVTEPARKQELDDHEAAADPHTGYRLESADHSHQSSGAQAGQLDHGLALSGLLDDDHTQYQKESEKDAASGYAGLTAGTKLNLAQIQEVMAHTDLTDSPADAHHNKQHPLTSTTEHSLSGATDGQKLAATGASTWAFEDDIETINFIIDGGGSAITTGQKGHIVVDFACTVVAWTILADQSGSIVVDVWKDTYANFPPTVADTITGTEKPTLASVQKNQDTSLTTWTTTIAAGDILAYNVDSAATVTRVVVALKVRRT